MEVVKIKLEDLKIHPNNVRKEYEGIDELSASIKENGIMQNLTVAPDASDAGKYFVVIGNRRLIAARQAGIDSAPCVIVENMSMKDQVTTMLTENMNRKDLKVYEEASAIQMCFKDFGINMDEMEQKTGLSKTTINHRLNVAKLNTSVLREKAKNAEFQLSLTDLYALEKIEDIKKRNKVLKEATDSRDLANRARVAAKEELQEKTEKELIEMCKKRNIAAAPKEAENNFFSSKWEHIAEYDLTQKVPKQLKVGKEGSFFYIRRYGWFYIIKKTEPNKKVLSPHELAEKEKSRLKKELTAKYKELYSDMGDFIRNIFDGKVQPVKDTEKVEQMLWDLFLVDSSYIDKDQIKRAILGKSVRSVGKDDEQMKEATEKAAKLPMLYQKLACAYSMLEDNQLLDWRYNFIRSKGDKILRLYNILEEYGYSWSKEEHAKLVSGEHEIYSKLAKIAS